MFANLLVVTGTLCLTSAVYGSYQFADELDEEVFREVSRRLQKVRADFPIVHLDEWSYRHLVLPGNPNFSSVVLLVDSRSAKHSYVFEVFRLVARRFHERSTDNDFPQVKGALSAPIFFYVDVSEEGWDWILSLHSIKFVPDLLRFGPGRTVQPNGTFIVDNFNRWAEENIIGEPQLTPTELFGHIYRFCQVNPQCPSDALPLTANLKNAIRLVISILRARLWVVLICVVFVGLVIYALTHRPSWLFWVGSVTLYVLNVGCIPSALVTYTSYGPDDKKIGGFTFSAIVARLFTASTKTQYIHEGLVVSVLLLVLSAIVVTIGKCALSGPTSWSVVFVSTLLIVVAVFINLIFDHKGQPYSVQWLPAAHLPVGGIDIDRNRLF